MIEENMNQDFRLENIDEARNCFIGKINKINLMSKKHKKVYTSLNYIGHLLILASAVTGCFNFCFCFFIIGITSSAIGLKFCEVTARI